MPELYAIDTAAPLTAREPVPDELLSAILEPYRPECRYLRRAWIEYDPSSPTDKVSAHGAFAIPQSFYIAATGHFNAVEFNLCYNQLAYVLVASAIHLDLLSAFSGWTLEDYRHRQLRDFLIVRFASEFRSPINGSAFAGTVSIDRLETRRRSIFITTRCRFSDECGGLSRGEVVTAVVTRAS